MKKKKPQELDRIIKRIKVIEEKRPGYKDILNFFKYIIREQYKIKPLIKVEPVDINEETAKQHIREGFSLIDKKDIKLDMDSATTLFKKMCRGLQRKNVNIAVEAKKISQAVRKKEIDLEELFRRVRDGDKGYLDFIANKAGVHKWLLRFLAENSIKPSLEAYAEMLKGYVDQESWYKGLLPCLRFSTREGRITDGCRREVSRMFLLFVSNGVLRGWSVRSAATKTVKNSGTSIRKPTGRHTGWMSARNVRSTSRP